MTNADETEHRVVIVMGSARPDGNTACAVHHLAKNLGGDATVIDLARLTIGAFEYSHHEDRDGFRSVIRAMLASEHIVFATPVYWYAMSGTMKVFFDRLTDLLLDPESRQLGRALAGRNAWLLATGTDECLPLGFHEPFERTTAYFGMIWRQAFYCRSIEGALLTSESLSQAETLASLIDI
jgi:multimeric flavodoxin WrbA